MDCCRSRVQRLIKKIIKKLLTKLLTNNQKYAIISTERKRTHYNTKKKVIRTMTNYYITENERDNNNTVDSTQECEANTKD